MGMSERESVGNVGSRFFPFWGRFSIADRVGIGIDLMLLVENIGCICKSERELYIKL